MATTTVQTNAEETGQAAAESWYQFTQSLPSGPNMFSGLKTIVMIAVAGLIGYGLVTSRRSNPRHRRNPSKLQAFRVEKGNGGLGLARHLDAEYGSKGIAVGKRYYHIRVRDPDALREAGYTRFRMRELRPGLLAVIAAKGRRPA